MKERKLKHFQKLELRDFELNGIQKVIDIYNTHEIELVRFKCSKLYECNPTDEVKHDRERLVLKEQLYSAVWNLQNKLLMSRYKCISHCN